VAQFLFVEWLLLWLRESLKFEFEWDQGNRDKNVAKHKVTVADIEEVFTFGLAIPLGIQVTPPVPEQRLGIVGPTSKGQYLTLVFTMREGRVRVISARPTHRKERDKYEAFLRKISQGI
jgi:uncharacterized DUF497 family protein